MVCDVPAAVPGSVVPATRCPSWGTILWPAACVGCLCCWWVAVGSLRRLWWWSVCSTLPEAIMGWHQGDDTVVPGCN